MGEVVLTEIIEDIDLDHDSLISIDEYIKDILDGEEVDKEELREQEKNNFQNFLDKNKDGVLDRSEVKEWILPVQYDFARAEAEYLITVSDLNEDKKLTKIEVEESYKVFLGSQVTDYGKGITRHEEL